MAAADQAARNVTPPCFYVLSWDPCGISLREVGQQRPLAVPGIGFLPAATVRFELPPSSSVTQKRIEDDILPSVCAVGSSAIASHSRVPGLHCGQLPPAASGASDAEARASSPWKPMQPSLPFAFPSVAATHEGAVSAVDGGGDLWTAPPSSGGSSWASDAARLLTPAVLPPASANVRFSSLAAGWSHTVAVDSGGGAWAWGGNAHSQCGEGGAATASAARTVQNPQRLQLPAGLDLGGQGGVVQAAAGAYHSLLLTAEGGVWGVGWGGHGQLGIGSPMQCVSAVHSAVEGMKAGVHVQQGGAEGEGPLMWMGTPPGTLEGGVLPLSVAQLTPVEHLETDIIGIAASGTASAAVSKGGDLFVWGGHVPGWEPPPVPGPSGAGDYTAGHTGANADVVLLPGRQGAGAAAHGTPPSPPCTVALIPCVPFPARVPLHALQQELKGGAGGGLRALQVVAGTAGMSALLCCRAP